MASPRQAVSSFGNEHAFARGVRTEGIQVLIEWAQNESLRWEITYLLHEVDDPFAVEFIVREMSIMQRRQLVTGGIYTMLHNVPYDWARRSERNPGFGMSDGSRNRLASLWKDTTEDKYVRIYSLRLWSARKTSEDITIMKHYIDDEVIVDEVLAALVKRGDVAALPLLASRLADNHNHYWWGLCDSVWDEKLFESLSKQLANKSNISKWGDAPDSVYAVYRILCSMPADQCEAVVLRHWDHLRFCPILIQVAFYVGTAKLIEAAKNAMSETPCPEKMLDHLPMTYGIRHDGRPGPTEWRQIQVLEPYLAHMKPSDIHDLWEHSNERGWIEERKRLLDPRLGSEPPRSFWSAERFRQRLDAIVTGDNKHFLHYDIPDYLKTGVTWGEIRDVAIEWALKTRGFNVLCVICFMYERHASRGDWSRFMNQYGTITEAERAITENAKYAIERRSAS